MFECLLEAWTNFELPLLRAHVARTNVASPFLGCLDDFFEVNFWGSSCSTVVEQTPLDREAVGSNPACGAGLFSSPLNLISSLIKVPHGRCNASDFPIFKELFLSVQLDTKQV